MFTKTSGILTLAMALLLPGFLAAQQKPDEIPDAPSATRPLPPPEPPSPRPGANTDEEAKPEAPPADPSSVTTGSKELPHTAPDATEPKQAPPPMPPVKTVPEGSVPRNAETGVELYKIAGV